MSAIEDLTEVAQRAAAAAAMARSSRWLDRKALQRKISEIERSLGVAGEIADRRLLGSRSPSEVWRRRTLVLLGDADSVDGATGAVEGRAPGVADAVATGQADRAAVVDDRDGQDARAAVAEVDAAAAVNVARIALLRAYLAVLEARLAAIDAGDTHATDAAVRGLRPLARSNQVAAHGFTVGRDVRAELRHIVSDRPRDIALRIGISLGFGLGYLAILRFLLWRAAVEHEFPYLALYAFSGIAGSVICTNALCVDAARVRAKLLSGERLWHILVAKNLAIGVIVGALGLVLNVLVLISTRNWAVFLKANGMFVTMLLLWFGVGNVLSILSPLRAEPLSHRARDGTLIRFGLSFVVSYGLSYAVNLMLYWRVWAKQTLLERFSSPWVPVLLVVGSAVLTYVLFTVLALSLAQQSPRRRALVREMVDYRAAAAAPAS
jgi:uncharacterized membrane protein YbhN (UPF0104 family)